MAELTPDELKKFFVKYKKRLARELSPEAFAEGASISYSRAYEIFKSEQVSTSHTLYERACNFSAKILKLKLKPKDIEKVEPALRMAHLATTPQGVYAFATLTTIIIMLLGALIGFLFGNFLIIIVSMFAALGAFFYMPTIPRAIFQAWRAKASDQIILAVLYMIIYMEHTPNLELAVWFAAKHLPPPLSLDFIKVLWDVETKKYTTIQASLEDYIETWRGWSNEFIESVHLLETALYQTSKEEQLKTLEKAEQVILEGTQDHMMAFAHNLQSPITTLHMLGIVLPIMGLVMLPMVSAFMGAAIKWYYLVALYNVLLPIVVYAIAKSVLAVRPAGANPTDVYLHLEQKYRRPAINILGFKLKAPPALVGVTVFILIAFPAFLYFSHLLTLSSEELKSALFSTTAVLFSVEITAALGCALAVYYWYKVKHLIKIKKEITEIENEFASAIFQLGNRIAEGIPVELSFSRIIESMPKAKVTNFFRIIDANIRQRGLSLKAAIFNPRIGAIVYYPSAIIKSVMHTLLEGAKKSPRIAADSLITISRYLRNVHLVNERLKDLLADTISSMGMQIKLFAPAIAGIVVSLGVLTTTILLSLGEKLAGFEAAPGGAPGFGAGLLAIFQIEYMIPSPLFQLIVGLYLVQIVFIMTFLLSGIVNGPDKIERENMLAKNLFLSTIFYVVITIICTLLFTGLVSTVVEAV